MVSKDRGRVNAIDPVSRPIIEQEFVDDGLSAVRLARRLTCVVATVTLVVASVAAARMHPVVVGPLLAALFTTTAAVCSAWSMASARQRAALPRRPEMTRRYF